MRKPLVQKMTDELKNITSPTEKQHHKFIMHDFCQWLIEVETKCMSDANMATSNVTPLISERLLGRADVAQELRQMIEEYIKRELTNE